MSELASLLNEAKKKRLRDWQTDGDPSKWAKPDVEVNPLAARLADEYEKLQEENKELQKRLDEAEEWIKSHRRD